MGSASVQDGALPAGLDLALAKEHDNTISVWCMGTQVSGQTATQGYTLVVK